jgi:hypothetical protein
MPASDTLGLRRVASIFVFRVAEVCFDGVLPKDNAVFVASLLSILPPETSTDSLEEIAPHLFFAVEQYKCMDGRYPL